MESHMAIDGQEAFDAVKRRFESTGTTYKLIIMDVFMPVCDGFKSVKMIQKYFKDRDKEGFSLDVEPFICFLTSHHQTVIKKASKMKGVNCTLQKPIFKSGIQSLLLNAKLLQGLTE